MIPFLYMRVINKKKNKKHRREKPRNSWGCQKLEGKERSSPNGLEGAWPCRNPDFGLQFAELFRS